MGVGRGPGLPDPFLAKDFKVFSVRSVRHFQLGAVQDRGGDRLHVADVSPLSLTPLRAFRVDGFGEQTGKPLALAFRKFASSFQRYL